MTVTFVMIAWVAMATSVAADASESPTARSRLDLGEVEALYRTAILEDGGIEDTVAELRKFAQERGRESSLVADAFLKIAHLQWRYGAPSDALAAVDQALRQRAGADEFLLKARLLDAQGRAVDAANWYAKAESATKRIDEIEFIRVRLTMTGVNDANADALVTLARQRDQAFRNRAAVVLAILGYQAEAIRLYSVTEELGGAYQQHVRVAEWAVIAGDFRLAQSHSWEAYPLASTRNDALYALAVLVESYRKSDAIDELLTRLQNHPEPNDDFHRTRIDLLAETGRFDEAIDLFKGSGESDVNGATRQRLIGFYESAGRTDEMIREYDRLIDNERGEVSWYAGLASHYLNVGSIEDAKSVWTRFAASNKDSFPALIAGGELMSQMGFFDDAAAMVEAALSEHGADSAALAFLYEGYIDRGREEEALGVLARLKAGLPPGAGELRDVADAYERLGQPEKALEVYRELKAGPSGLGYDGTMRLAWLYGVTGRKQTALGVWKDLWVTVDSPARRVFAESQLLLLAAELNVLGDIVVELEEKLALKTANRNEVNLLINIYVEVGDKISAVEVVEEFTRQSGLVEVETLRQLAQVYLSMRDFIAYDKALRRLTEIDPDNKVEHIRKIILNILENGITEYEQQRVAEIRRWLDELRALDADAVSGEFEASILSSAGYREDAIKSYRQVLVRFPNNSDNLLLMADLMKNTGRRDEAVSLLQYAAEHAGSDDEFVAAVDGIINMIGARGFGETLTPEHQAVFRWTQRVILERIARGEDKFYLYQLLSDIAQETRDIEGQFAATENSLSQAGMRRASILRELITLSTQGYDDSTGGVRPEQAERKITYGRRLVALQQELPPEIYFDLARSLLSVGDTLGAEKALDMVNDITGLINIAQTKAGLFYETGYPDRALQYYNEALSSDSENFEILNRTAMLYEESRQDDVANALYARATQVLLRRQPAVQRNTLPPQGNSPFGEPVDTSVTRDYRSYFEGFAQGLMITWPADQGSDDGRIAPLRSLFDVELKNIVASFEQDQKLPLARYTRLARTADLLLRLAGARELYELAAHLDRRLLDNFGDDEQYLENLVDRYVSWGRPVEYAVIAGAAPVAERLAARSDSAASPLQQSLALALQDGSLATAVRIAKIRGDERELSAILRRPLVSGELREGLTVADATLDDVEFRNIVAPLLPTIRQNRAALFELIASDPALILRVDERLERPLLSEQEILGLLLSGDFGNSVGSQSMPGLEFVALLKAKLSPGGLIRYYAEQVERLKPDEEMAASSISIALGELLALELTPAQAKQVAEIFISYLSKQDSKSEPGAYRTLENILVSGVHPNNRSVIYEVAEYWKQKSRSQLDPVSVLKAIYETPDDTAFDALLRLSRELGPRASYISRKVLEMYRRSDVRMAENILASDSLGAAEAHLIYQIERDSGERERLVDMLTRLTKAFPNDYRYVLGLAKAYFESGDRSETEKLLRNRYSEHENSRFARAVLFFNLVSDERFVEALAVATDGREDLSDTATMEGLFEQLLVDQDINLMQWFETITGQARQQSFPGSFNKLQDLVVAVADGDDDKAHTLLRTVWRAAAGQPFLGSAAGALLQISFDPDTASNAFTGLSPGQVRRIGSLADLIESGEANGDSNLLASEIAKASYTVAEFEAYLTALPEERRKSMVRVYRFLVEAYEAGGQLSRRLETLSDRLLSGPIGDHDFTVWMMLARRAGTNIDGRLTAAFAERAADIVRPSRLQILNMARLSARSGDVDRAGEYLRLLATQLAWRGTMTDPAAASQALAGGGQAVPNLSALVDEIVGILPTKAASDVLQGVLLIARPVSMGDSASALYDAFLLQSLQKLLDPKDVLEAAGRISPAAVKPTVPTVKWDVPRLLELTRVYAATGDRAAALRTLKLLLSARLVVSAQERFDPRAFVSDERFALAGLAQTYGLPFLEGGIANAELAIDADFVFRHQRVFPGNFEKAKSGSATEWAAYAAAKITDWLDEGANDPDRIVEMALVAVYQLERAGDSERAIGVVLELAERISGAFSEYSLQSVRNVALMSVHLDVVLPSALRELIFEKQVLTARKEAAALRDLGEQLGPSKGFQASMKIAAETTKLGVLEELRRLAVTAGEAEYVADLTARIEKTENARQLLDLNKRSSL